MSFTETTCPFLSLHFRVVKESKYLQICMFYEEESKLNAITVGLQMYLYNNFGTILRI